MSELPNQMQEMDFAESSTGARQRVLAHRIYSTSSRAWDSAFDSLIKKEITWVGMRAWVEFTLPPARHGGHPLGDDDPDRRDLFEGKVTIDMLEVLRTSLQHQSMCKARACQKTWKFLGRQGSNLEVAQTHRY